MGYPGTPQMQHGMSPMSTPGRMGMGTPMGTPHHAGAMGSSPGMPHGYPGMCLFSEFHNTLPHKKVYPVQLSSRTIFLPAIFQKLELERETRTQAAAGYSCLVSRENLHPRVCNYFFCRIHM